MYRNTIYRKETLQGKVYSELLRNIVTGKFPPGTPLPSRTELENEFNAGKETIKKVLKKLAENGYIHPRCRRSALVAKKLPSHHYTIAMPVCVADSLNEFDYLDSPISLPTHLGDFQVFASMNKAAMNFRENIFQGSCLIPQISLGL